MAAESGVQVDAPAKVNLWLRVLAREESGYHSLETLFCALDLADPVEVRRAAAGATLQVTGGVDTGPPERNLAIRAAHAWSAAAKLQLAVAIRLHKRIPSGAGLGGGSADAAATLIALNRLHGDPLAHADLVRLGGELGSDVPFFLCGSPLALAWSRGERLLPLAPLPARSVVVAHPGVPIATAEAYRQLAERRAGASPPGAALLPGASELDWAAVAARAANDFEAVAADLVPAIAPMLAAIRSAGAAVALLAGSGSAVFGVFDQAASAEAAAAALRGGGCTVWRTRTRSAMPTPTRVAAD